MSLILFPNQIFEHNSFSFELRILQPKDAAAFHRFVEKNLEYFHPNFPVTCNDVMKGVSATKRWISQKMEDLEMNRSMSLVLRNRDSGEIIGCFSAFGFDWRVPKCETAWMLDNDWLGMGLATTSLRKGIHYLLEVSRLEKIICRVEPTNIKSIALAKRLGFEVEGIHRKDFRNGDGKLVDVEYMAIWR